MHALRLGMSPTIMTIGPYRFYFWAQDGEEREHVHIDTGKGEVKFWLMPDVELARADRSVKKHVITKIEKLVRQHQGELVVAWEDFFGT